MTTELEEVKQSAMNLLDAARIASEKFGFINTVSLQSSESVLAPLMKRIGIVPEITEFDLTYNHPYQVNYHIDNINLFFLSDAKKLKKLGILGDFPENITEFETTILAEERAKNKVYESRIAELELKNKDLEFKLENE